METFDYLIVGGGIFGCYAATWLAEQGARILLIEKENDLFLKASTVNQARIHSGYHYPRSIATARLSEEYKARFIKDHRSFINDSFQHFYAIDKFGSMTDAAQFERFCKHLEVPCRAIEVPRYMKKERIERLYETQEFSFDPIRIGGFYKRKLEELPNVTVLTNCQPKQAFRESGNFIVELEIAEKQHFTKIKSANVINATYSATNGILDLFAFRQIELTHEIAEMTFVKSPKKQLPALTVMDGSFCSLMPYGLSEFYSLSSVAYTPHEVSKTNQPKFNCQQINTKCRPEAPSDCNQCAARPMTNFSKMEKQIRRYLDESVELEYAHSKFTIKSKLKSSHIDDSRPTEVLQLSKNPSFYCIFAGKINSIYHIEQILSPKSIMI